MTQRIDIADYRARLAKAGGKGKRIKSHPVEQDLVRETLQALTLQLGVFCWRNSSGVIPIGTAENKRYFHASPKGSPDIFGVLRGGKLFGLEAKSKTGKSTAAQKAWGVRMVKLGACYAEYRSISEGVEIVRGWQMNEWRIP